MTWSNTTHHLGLGFEGRDGSDSEKFRKVENAIWRLAFVIAIITLSDRERRQGTQPSHKAVSRRADPLSTAMDPEPDPTLA